MTRTIVGILAWAAAVSAAPAAGAAGADAGSSAVAALAAQVEAWNRGDLEAFTSIYADDCTFVTPNGIARGREAVLARYRERYPDRAAMGTLAIEVEDVRALRGAGSDVVAVSIVGRWSLDFEDPAKDDASGWTLVVLERTADGGWRMVQDASM